MTTVALAQPLLDLLGRNAAFFVAHNATAADVVSFALGVTLIAPLIVAGIVLAVGRVSAPVAAALHACVLTLLGAVLVLVVFQRSGAGGALPGLLVVGVAALIGIAVPLAYRSAAVRRACLLLAIAGPVVAGLFLFASPAQALVFPQPPADTLDDLGPDAPPIVVVVLDELPLASLLTEEMTIDEAAFPSFARLAGDATWFRNSSTVHGQTSDAVPAALTGLYPDYDKLPVAADHPGNLFALLSGTYDMNVVEPLTELCPPGQCRRPAAEPGSRLPTLLTDLGVVTGHLVLPPDLAATLPPIDQGWRNFKDEVGELGKETAFRDRFRAARLQHPGTPFEQFTANIDAADDPALHYLHVLLPHSPWRYAADGREYDQTTERPGIVNGRWVNDPWRVAQGYQRHLVQLQLTDRLLGELLDRLEAEGLYEESLVVVMADHGASFTPGTSQRVISEATFPEIGVVPFFVKQPGQTQGAASDRPVELIDVLPTILDVLGAQPRTGLDGVSAFDDRAPPRDEKRFHGFSGILTFEPTLDAVAPIVARKQQIFSASTALPFPYGMAPDGTADLLGSPAPEGPAAPGLTVDIENDEVYSDVDTSLPTVPAMVSGTLAGPTPQRPVVAVAVNGTVAALTLTDDPAEPEGRRFRALVPPHLLRDGANDIEVFLVDDAGGLEPLARG